MPTCIYKEIRVKSIHKPYRIHALGDFHIGGGCDVRKLKKAVNEIAREKCSVILMGDLADYIAPGDKRFDPKSIPPRYRVKELARWGHLLVREAAEILEPIADKILAVLPGNHEEKYRMKTACEVHDELCETLDVEASEWLFGIYLKFIDDSGSTAIRRIGAAHGSTGATTDAGKNSALEKLHRLFHANTDFVLMGHIHSLHQYYPSIQFEVGRHGFIERERGPAIATGSYAKTYRKGASGYGEKRQYPPSVLGHPCIEMVPATGKITIIRCS